MVVFLFLDFLVKFLRCNTYIVKIALCGSVCEGINRCFLIKENCHCYLLDLRFEKILNWIFFHLIRMDILDFPILT